MVVHFTSTQNNEGKNNFTGKFVVSRCTFCKLWRDLGFFCSVNHLSGSGVNANHNTGRGRYARIFKSRSNPTRLRVMAERKGQVFVDERAIIVQLRWV